MFHGIGCTCCAGAVSFEAAPVSDLEFSIQLCETKIQQVEAEMSRREAMVLKLEDAYEGPPLFIEEELFMTEQMADAVWERAKPYRDLISAMFDLSQKANGSDPRDIMLVLEAAAPEMETVFDDIEDSVSKSLARSLNLGAVAVPVGAISDTPSNVPGKSTVFEGYPSVQTVHQGILAAAKYTTNNFFNTQIIPTITAEIDRILADTPPTEPAVFRSVLTTLDKRLKSVPYWNVVANAAASRAYHYGFLRAAQILKYRVYRFTALLDARTSDVCRYMDGKTFPVQDALDYSERLSQLSVEELKVMAPWPKYEDVENADVATLVSNGFMFPPLHGRCRSTITVKP